MLNPEDKKAESTKGGEHKKVVEEKKEEVKEEKKVDKSEVVKKVDADEKFNIEDFLPKEPNEEDDKGHMERSDLGRKVGDQGRDIADLKNSMDKLVNILTTNAQGGTGIDDNIPLTGAELDKKLDERDRNRVKEVNDYKDTYVNTVHSMANISGTDPKWHQAVVNELDTNSVKYLKQTGEPKADAMINYGKAEKAILLRYSRPKQVNPLKGKETRSPMGSPEVGKTDEKTNKVIKLDPEAAKLKKQLGLSDEQVKKSLEDTTPMTAEGDK